MNKIREIVKREKMKKSKWQSSHEQKILINGQW